MTDQAIRYTLADIAQVFGSDEEFVRAQHYDRAMAEIARLQALLAERERRPA